MATKTSLDEYGRKRDFEKTAEPPPKKPKGKTSELGFVIQKHAASHLHYDLRLELDGVMKSWAVPKGPSANPSVKRLAMQVEDHPIEYNTFEGTIPKGQYGGGTVMIWDRGTYEPDEVPRGKSPAEAVRRGLAAGKLSFTFHGDRMRGSYALVRTGGKGDGRQWLLIKHSDEAATDAEPTERYTSSVVTGRSMEAIAAGVKGARSWRSNRARGKQPPLPPRLEPMLAKTAEPGAGEWVFEPKYDGIRVLAFATEGEVALVSRNGHDKAAQFPEVVEALRELASHLAMPVVLDGEIVPIVDGKIGRFGDLQGRMHLTGSTRIERAADEQPAAFIAFDALLAGEDTFINQPWRDRRAELEALLADAPDIIRISEVSDDRDALTRRGEREGWEGLIAKRPAARYRPGVRSGDWLKLKLENQQEFVVGGWTEPRKSRQHLGAILLGYYDDAGDFIYAGHTGGGFSGRALEDMYRRLRPLERKTPPFKNRPRPNEKPHWTTPRVVVQVRFNEWTKDGRLRHPIFLGVRDDRDPKSVGKEPVLGERGDDGDAAITADAGVVPSARSRQPQRDVLSADPPVRSTAPRRGRTVRVGRSPVLARLRKLRKSKQRGGTLRVDPGIDLSVTSLDKVFFPETGHTKGDLLEYYAAMSELILPNMADRPLVLKRFPNGVTGQSFYQQAAPDDAPDGVRVETIVDDDGEPQARLVGGNLTTLLYTIQLGAISFDPWHSRIGHLGSADYTVIDLDPGPDSGFKDVVEIARKVREQMDELELHGGIKTSGSSGIHIYLPLPPGTPLEAATLVAQIVATRVATRYPELATVKRMRRDRAANSIYVDYLQNILGKTVAGVYAVRAKPTPTVSTPLGWDELTGDLDPREFTVDTVPARIKEVGDLWASAMVEPIDLSRMLALAR